MQEMAETQAAITASQESIDSAERRRLERVKQIADEVSPDFTSHFGGNRAQRRAAERALRKKK